MPFLNWRGRDDHWRGRDDHWRGRDDHWRDRDRGREHHDEPRPGFHLPLPPLFPPLFEAEGDYMPGEQEAERSHYRRSHWPQSQPGQGEGEFEPAWTEPDYGPRSGRWVRRRGRIILLDV